MDYDNFIVRTLALGTFGAVMDDYGNIVYLTEMPWGYGFVTSLQVY